MRMKTVRRSLAMIALAGATLAPVASAYAQMAPPMVKAHIYEDNANPHKDLAAAVATARREHKRVLVDFGGNWCGDCQVLDIYFHQQPNREILEKNYIVVHVSVGPMGIEKNLDVPTGLGINIKKGVPALAVLDGRGKVVYSQATGEFENMRNMNANSVTDFLNKWKV